MPDTRPIPIILDVDTGIDDSLALLYACASPEAELVAVTCVAGNIDLDNVQRNTRAVLELGGRADVEVALGADRPLVRPLEVTPETHGPRGLGYAELPEPSRAASQRPAADVLVEEARRRPRMLTLIAVGPLTNVAVALQREQELPMLLRRLVIMGGAYRVPGNTAPTTEWNAQWDPEATKAVFDAFGAPDVQAARESMGLHARPLALGLDVTEKAKLTPDHLADIAARCGDDPAAPRLPILRYLADALRFYMEFHSRYDGFYGAFIHDPWAVAAALDSSLVRADALTVDVELAGTLTAGETVTDWRRVWGRSPTLDVAVEADVTTFLDRFV
ncbi:MAG TPA: nucleoside hydrolase, partial [Candidatus Saccharimonadia bacterium]|nr:nucleoside hydrolase [Candidatus Saccharimonadia bacterium]